MREMLMKALLYAPLGVAHTELMGSWSVVLALAMSLENEVWQYLAYTGYAHATGALCNTLGCAVGALPWLVTEGLCSKRADNRGSVDE